MTKNPQPIAYEISKKMYKNLLDTRSKSEMTMNPKDYIINYLNREFGLKGTVKQVQILEEGF